MNVRSHFAASLLFCILLGSGCSRPSSDEQIGEKAPAPKVAVGLDSISRGSIVATVTAIGRTDAVRKEDILSPIAGKIVVLKALEGDLISEGQALCILRPKEAQAALDGAAALLRSASTPRQRNEAQRMLALADSVQSTVEVHSSFGGVVVSRGVTEGQYVVEQTPLFTVVDLHTIDFLANVPLDALPAVQIGQRAMIRFDLLSAHSVPATVDGINPRVDSQTQSAAVRLRFDGLAPLERRFLGIDMMGTATIITGTHRNVLLVPRSALLRDDETNTYSIVTVTPDSLALTIPVTLRLMGDTMAEVEGRSLTRGLPVVTEGNYALPDSTRVTAGHQ